MFVNPTGQTLSGVISGSGSLSLTGGDGVLNLAGVNTYAGTTTIAGGEQVNVGTGSAEGTLGAGTITDNGVLVFDDPQVTTVNSQIGGSGNLTQEGSGTLILAQTNSYASYTQINANSTIQVGQGGSTGSLGQGNIEDNGLLVFNRGDSPTVGNWLAGTGKVNQQGPGSLTLTNGSNSYTGGTAINGGTLSFASGALGDGGTITFGSSNTTLQWYGSNNQDISGRLAIGNNVNAYLDVGSNNVTLASAFGNSQGGALTKAGVGTLILTASDTFPAGTTINAGALMLGSGGTTGSLGTGTVTDNASLAFNYGSTVTFSNVVNGTGSLTQQGSGTLILSGNNTFSGGTAVNSGDTLQVGGSSANVLGTGTALVNGTLDLHGYSPTLGGLSGSGVVQSTVAGSCAERGERQPVDHVLGGNPEWFRNRRAGEDGHSGFDADRQQFLFRRDDD